MRKADGCLSFTDKSYYVYLIGEKKSDEYENIFVENLGLSNQ